MDDLDPAVVNVLARTLARVVVTAWPLAPPAQLTPLNAGGNNLVYRVETATSPACILRVLRSHHDADRVRHEVALLTALRDAPLPFDIPIPLPTRAGALVQHLDQDDYTLLANGLAVLCVEIPGRHPDRSNSAQAQAAGTALALLDTALAAIDPAALPGHGGLPARGLWRHLSGPEEAETILSRLPISRAETARLLDQYEAVGAELATLYAAGLPWQLIHGDVGPDNVLVVGGGGPDGADRGDGVRVTGLLDFEFVRNDLRIHDLVVALRDWSGQLLGTGAEWGVMDALGRGYSAHLPLLSGEVQALPVLFRWRMMGGLQRDLTWFQEGRRNEQQLLERLEYTRAWERWMQENESRLLAMAERWSSQG